MRTHEPISISFFFSVSTKIIRSTSVSLLVVGLSRVPSTSGSGPGNFGKTGGFGDSDITLPVGPSKDFTEVPEKG